jgi:hypothetical protein
MSVPVSVHQPAPDRTVAVWLDSSPDLTSINSTQAHWVDGEHWPTDLAVGGSNPSRRAPKPRVEAMLAHSCADRGLLQTDLVGSGPVWWMIRPATGLAVCLPPCGDTATLRMAWWRRRAGAR